MKKLLLLVMCLVLALGLCGCGKGGSVAADPVLEPCREAKLPRGRAIPARLFRWTGR